MSLVDESSVELRLPIQIVRINVDDAESFELAIGKADLQFTIDEIFKLR